MSQPPAIVVAPNSYKGTLRCDEAAAWMAEGVRRALSDLPEGRRPAVRPHPVADGGEGTLAALQAAIPSARVLTQPVLDPLGTTRVARFLVLDPQTAVVEVAEACGLHLVPPGRRDPWLATSFGAGQLIRAALRAGCRRVYVALGGSATVDGGIGLAQALGFRVLDEQGRDVPFGGQALERVARIDASGVDPRVREAEFIGLADVRNPLHGPEGAAAVFGPQKGATPEQVARLDAGLARLAACIARDLGREVADAPGAGAAGGMGAAVLGLLGGRLEPGAEALLRLTGFDRALEGAVLVITGEGRLDGQTRYGKAPWVVARRAREAGVPALAVVGCLGPDAGDGLGLEPFAAVVPLWPEPPDEEAAARDAGPRLAAATARTVALLRLGARVFPAGTAREVAPEAARAGVADPAAPGSDVAAAAPQPPGGPAGAEQGGRGRRRRRRRRRRPAGPAEGSGG